MKALPIVELLTIGREILDGRVVDTNSIFMAESLKELGLVPRYAQRVDDNLKRILEAYTIASRRSDVILVTGGLGPTSDDITAESLGRFLNEPLALNTEALAQLTARLTTLGRPVTETQKKQALLPPSCFVLSNPEGTAPGFAFERSRSGHANQQWFFMPGVPREMKRMMREQVLPRLPRVAGYRSRSWATQFTAEARLQEKLTPIEQTLPAGFEVTYRTRYPENYVGLHADCATPDRVSVFDDVSARIRTALADDVFTEAEGTPLASLEEVVVKKLIERKAFVASVESCTGGLVASRITDISGSSATFWFGAVTYDDAAKIDLGVPQELLSRVGAVSREVAIALSEAGLAKLQRLVESESAPTPSSPTTSSQTAAPLTTVPRYCLATTGIAGPTGGTPEKPVGLCHIALARSNGPTIHEQIQARVGLDRLLMKTFFAQKALDLLRRHL